MPIRITGLASGLDTESIISALVSSYSYKTDKYKKAQKKLSWKQDAWKTLNSKIYSFYKEAGNLKYSSAYSLKTASISDSTKASVSVSGNAAAGVQTLEVKSVAKSEYITGAQMKLADNTSKDKVSASTTLSQLGYSGSDASFEVTNKETGKVSTISVSADTKVSDFVDQLKKAGLSANFDATNQRIFIASSKAGTDNTFDIKSQNADGDKALLALGLSMDSTVYDSSAEKNSGNSRISAENATIVLNGATYTSSTNDFNINGVSITALGVTDANSPLTLTVATDTQGIYDKVKSFLSSYNALVNEMTSLYNADNAKGYEPLTDDEKDQMSDSEIEKWETKIKDSLLRRDDTLSGILNSMTNAMSKSYTINDKSYSLSTFGISTLGYLNASKNEQYAYHIDGDEEDSSTSGNEDKLMAAIKNDPDSVVDFMKQLSKGLYDAMDQKMKSSRSLRSSLTFYNDKEMASEYSDYTETITKWEDKLTDMEDFYYKKFSAMETALSKLQSQTSSLSGLFGS